MGGRNPFKTISKKELLKYLEPKLGKKLLYKNKTDLCKLWKSIQESDVNNVKETKGNNKIDEKLNAKKENRKKTLKFRNNVDGTLENIKEISKLNKNMFNVKLPQNNEKYSDSLTDCVNLIM